MEMKYIIFDNALPVIFSKGIEHNRVLIMTDTFKRKPTSAGFCSISEKNERLQVSVFGESDSLHLSPDSIDANLIESMINGKNS